MLCEDTHNEDMMSDQLEYLKTAYCVKVALTLVAADGDLTPGEMAILEELFPRATMQDHGFQDANGQWNHQLINQAHDEALAVLPAELSHADRLDLVETMNRIVWADRSINMKELRVLLQSAEAMGIDQEELLELLDQTGYTFS